MTHKQCVIRPVFIKIVLTFLIFHLERSSFHQNNQQTTDILSLSTTIKLPRRRHNCLEDGRRKRLQGSIPCISSYGLTLDCFNRHYTQITLLSIYHDKFYYKSAKGAQRRNFLIDTPNSECSNRIFKTLFFLDFMILPLEVKKFHDPPRQTRSEIVILPPFFIPLPPGN